MSFEKYVTEINLNDYNDIAFVCDEMVGTCNINGTKEKRLILHFDKKENIQKVIDLLEGLKFMLSYNYDKELDLFSSKEKD